MIEITRMHPMKMIDALIKLVKDSIFIIILLFILNIGSDVSTLIKIFRVVFFIYITIKLCMIVIEWQRTTYEIKDETIHIRGGLFQRTHKTIPLYEIQNITWDTPLYYRMFQLTSLKLETSAASDSATVKLEAIKTDRAQQIEELATHFKAQDISTDTDMHEEVTEAPSQTVNSNPDAYAQLEGTAPILSEKQRTIHFTPTKKDLIKASFLSFSFLALIPLLAVGYQNLEQFIDVDKQAEGVLAFLTQSWIITTIAIILLIVIALVFGIVHTFLKYGKYEIASDEARIFIHRGVLSEKAFSIRKANVQAIQITQNPLKKLLGLAEIKLISAGSMDDESDDVRTLYPFLPIKHANNLMSALLPHLPMKEATEKLPKNAFYLRMIRVPWLLIIAAALIIWFKSNWWPAIIALFIVTYASRLFAYRNTCYIWDETGIHFKMGGLWTQHFITNRKKIIEIEIEQSWFQKKLGLANITTVNRVKPAHQESLEDIPIEAAHHFKQWYVQRYNDVEVKIEAD
ncbi:PH domain-containing protein [Lentibacillus saliphilus]|uniref:PH domain-containing protein n=1 Tax=Lentibacillus saliphilus TaxID=2737028 RepID=UPI001C2FAA8A|nr:PH domain-containing protein [Lentibacillus saliphilus]